MTMITETKKKFYHRHRRTANTRTHTLTERNYTQKETAQMVSDCNEVKPKAENKIGNTATDYRPKQRLRMSLVPHSTQNARQPLTQ